MPIPGERAASLVLIFQHIANSMIEGAGDRSRVPALLPKADISSVRLAGPTA